MRTVKIHRQRLIGLLVGLVVAAGASCGLAVSHAGTAVSSVEVEHGTIASPASSLTDSTASGGHAIGFGVSSGAIRSTNCTPAVGSTTNNTVSHLCGFPDSTNTGVPAGTSLVSVPSQQSSGPGWAYNSQDGLVVNDDGTVISGLNVTGGILVKADNVTIKNTKITGQGESNGIGLYSGVKNTLVQDTTITGTTTSGPNRLLVGIKDMYGNSTGTQMYRNDISDCSTSIQIANGIYEDNYIHDTGFNNGDHINGISVGGGDLTSMIIRHNTILNQRDQADAIALFQDFGNEANKTVDDNLMAGGSYSLYAGGGGHGTSYNMKITNNHFSRMYFSTGGTFGPVAAYDDNGSGNVFTGNIWDDTGATISP